MGLNFQPFESFVTKVKHAMIKNGAVKSNFIFDCCLDIINERVSLLFGDLIWEFDLSLLIYYLSKISLYFNSEKKNYFFLQLWRWLLKTVEVTVEVTVENSRDNTVEFSQKQSRWHCRIQSNPFEVTINL